ncbi:hypothetical protein A2773_03475 [Candidatus Gottesmanbacteria bacterium RIFCSPHIGHO2_01_FULL_39_10]|uniref:Cytidyltransferase-like domain-containing protein n=1 Tax=Candidatus Gottesmanbacteria bacterium RIFCSPHIGHO2_01_FULL_39_10 TaxID=1798375 RepID=A0A1F5ZQE2_9BACT|nr:MAG: hypothetical protein A2773_03475 [Candidatus Gottesmanbacteria bacterium RIFCSPHIGHO2_01_FULL_39_10]
MAKIQKIKKINSLRRIVAKLKSEGKKIVLCHGVFDLIHPGHIRHFQSAKKYGDILVVSITDDRFVKKGPGRPVFNQHLRAEVLSSIETIDYVTVVPSYSAIDSIKAIKPDFYVKGPDYKKRKVSSKIPAKLQSEEDAVREVGGKLVFTEDDIVFSSSKLINDYLNIYPVGTKKYLENLRKKYSPDFIIEKLATLSSIKILVIGDAIIDQYHYCFPTGKSSKEPIIVHQYIKDESFAGGILATANHLSSLSNNIRLVSVLGKKQPFTTFINKHLKKTVAAKFFFRNDTNTIVKRRYIDGFTKQKLFQISYLNDDFIDLTLEKAILNFLKKEIGNFDMVLVNDFGHGLMTDRIIRFISKKAKFLALNVQANSANYGFNVVTKYPRANFICIDDTEIRLATHDKYGELEVLIKKVFKKMKCEFIIVTKGPFGSLSYTGDGITITPALTDKVVDRVGAGDALFAMTSPLVAAKFDRELIPFIGNVAGAIQVQTVGNKKPIEFEDMARFINRLLK